MQIHELQRNTKSKKKRQIGRGGKRGKTSGRGTKGQNARAGRKKRPELRDMIKKIPKLRGYRFAPLSEKATVISLAIINKAFPKGGEITPQTLASKGVILKKGDVYPRVKILSDGEISSIITVSGCETSKGALEKIKKAGGAAGASTASQASKASEAKKLPKLKA
ncbi:MAG: uL15 family ribosomal protein [Candidatus Yonathbacteria bacterium]|nr:uL15 family ribosomal protein [Candidatus Yonathbacteria bacterium]